MNKWKIFGYTVITWLGFSVLAKLYVIVMQQQDPDYSIYDGISVIWSWTSLIMGVVMAIKLRKWIEFVFGLVFFVLCSLPFVGVFIGFGYFAWCYSKLEKKRLSHDNPTDTVKSDAI